MRLKRTALFLVTGALMTTLLQPTAALAGPNGPCSGGSYVVNHRTPPAVREQRVANLIRCIFTTVGIAGEIDTAMYVSWRESHRIPWAKNPWVSGACHPRSSTVYGSCGVFQHLARYWTGRVYAYVPRRFFPNWPNVSVLHARANIWAAARMVKAGGWGPWSTA